MIQNLFWDASSKLLSVIPVAFAQDTKPKTGGDTKPKITRIDLFDPLKSMDFKTLLNTILQDLTLLAIPVVTIMVIVGAYYIITSGGNPGRRTKGKDYVLWAAIGFGVLILADSVALIVTNFLTK